MKISSLCYDSLREASLAQFVRGRGRLRDWRYNLIWLGNRTRVRGGTKWSGSRLKVSLLARGGGRPRDWRCNTIQPGNGAGERGMSSRSKVSWSGRGRGRTREWRHSLLWLVSRTRNGTGPGRSLCLGSRFSVPAYIWHKCNCLLWLCVSPILVAYHCNKCSWDYFDHYI